MGMLLNRYRHTDNDTGVAEKAVAPSSPKVEKKEVKSTVTVDEIKAMNGTKLRKLAKENGIENPEELTVGELKAILCEKLG